jgi:hypothetical protein
LCGNDRSLNARQKLLRFGQGQSQLSNIANTFRPADLYQIGTQAAGITLCRNQPQHPSHPRSPSRLSTRPTVPSVSSYPHSLDTPVQLGGPCVQYERVLAALDPKATFAPGWHARRYAHGNAELSDLPMTLPAPPGDDAGRRVARQMPGDAFGSYGKSLKVRVPES